MEQEKKSSSSLNFVVGLALGIGTAAGAAFLYKTDSGKKFRKKFKHHNRHAKHFLTDLIDLIKKQAEDLELTTTPASEKASKDLKKAKKRLKGKGSLGKTKKKVFFKSGKPLVK